MKTVGVIFLFLSLHANAQCLDTVACRKVEDTLKVIKNFVTDRNSDLSFHRLSAVYFLLEISGIPYEGTVSFIGPESPTKSFFLKCEAWYLKNRRKLRWNENEKKITLVTYGKVSD